MTTDTFYDLTLFEGAAADYAQFRPKYPPALFAKLVEVFQLNGQGRLLDLGSGTGMIAIALSSYFQQVIAVDPAPEMLSEAQRQASLAQATNIIWLQQGAEQVTPTLGNFQLVTIGRAFHWMQREQVLERTHILLDDGGGLAILDTHEDPWKSTEPWKQAALSVVQKWLGKERRAGKFSCNRSNLT
jgi:ubiquinone/menaquinone biosynthesis C-methylase UbiE